MNPLVEQVVEVLNEGNPYMDGNRVLKKYLRKAPPRKRFIPRPAKTTGERDTYERSKEQQRKLAKTNNPHSSLRWDGYRWSVRAKQKEEIEQEYSLSSIQEISLRTGAIAIYLTKVKQYANAVDKGVMKLKSLSSHLQNASDEKERNRIQGEIVRVDADVLSSLRRMEMYSALVSASGGLGAPKETAKLIKKMEKRKRR